MSHHALKARLLKLEARRRQSAAFRIIDDDCGCTLHVHGKPVFVWPKKLTLDEWELIYQPGVTQQ